MCLSSSFDVEFVDRHVDIHGLCNAPSVYCRRRIRNVLVTVTVTVVLSAVCDHGV